LLGTGENLKLKPLIKTHWVASQNPLDVSLNGLKAVVFTPPASVLLPEFQSSPELRAVLPVQLAPQPLEPAVDEIHEVRNHRYSMSSNLYWRIFSGHELAPIGSSLQELKSLAGSIEFHFEDGQVLPLVGISRREGFPLFLNPQFYLQDPSCNWERAYGPSADEWMKSLKMLRHMKKSEDVRKCWFVILEIMGWALQRKRQTGDLEVLLRPRSESPQLNYHLQDIEIFRELPLAATVAPEKGSSGSARLRLWQGSSEGAESGVLRLPAADVLGELENYFFGPSMKLADSDEEPLPEEREILSLKSPGEKWTARFSSVESGLRSLEKSLVYLERFLRPERIQFVNHRLVDGSSFKPRILIEESEGNLQMAVSFMMENPKLEHFNFPANMAPIFGPFLGGLDQILKLERKDSASKHKQFRANDLLFLRHQGLMIFMLFEMLNWVLKLPLSSGQKLEFIDDLDSPEADQQFEKLMNYLQTSIPALLGKPSVPYRELISMQAQNIFRDYAEKLFHHLMQDRSLLFHADQVIEIKGVQSQVLPVVRFLILHFIENSRGKFLLRAQSPLGEKFPEGLTKWTEPEVRELESGFRGQWMELGLFDRQSISLLFEICDRGAQVVLNGTPLTDQKNPFEFIFSVTDSAIKEDTHLFDLHPQIFFNGTRVGTDEVKINFGQGQTGFIEYQGQVYRIDKKDLPSIKTLQRFWDKIKGLKKTGSKNKFGDQVYQLEKSQALDLLMLKTQGFQVTVEGEWKKIFDYFETGLGVEKISLPPEVEKNLLPHQLEGAQWLYDLYQLRLGAILADEMGLGKTFQILSFLSHLQIKKDLGKCLIVVPTSLVYNWMEERKKFAPDLPMQVYHPSQEKNLEVVMQGSDPMTLVTTYGLLIENPDFFQKYLWNVVAIDEAQALKNIVSQRSVTARKVKARFKVCVTGTPMENNYLEFYSLCDLVVPGCLGDVDSFRKDYYNREVRSESLRELRMISKPLVLRRTKSQVKLALPEKTIQKVSLPFATQQKEIYMKMAMTFSRQVDQLIQDQGERKAQIAMFAALMRLRQICSDPSAVPGVDYKEQPAKVEHFLNSLQDHLENEESVIVFTQFLSTLGRIEREMQSRGIPSYTLKGSVSAKERLRLIDEFQKGDKPAVMLMTLKTGGVGLNLTKASVVYHLEPWWNPAVENQATDRAHRMGQTKDVKVFNLLIEGSLEERIADLKIRKQDSFDRLFGVEEVIEETGVEGSQSLSREDFIYLLK
jgi:hypothetical protein